MDAPLLAIAIPQCSDKEYAALVNLVAGAMACLGVNWRITDAQEATMVFILVNSESSLDTLKEYHAQILEDQLVVCSQDGFPVHALWHLNYPSSRKLPSVLSLANLLSRVNDYLFYGHSLPPPVSAFNPSECLLGILLQARMDAIARICSLEGCPSIYLLPKEQSIYLKDDLEKIFPMALASPQSIRVEAVTDEQLLTKVGYVKFSSRLSAYALIDEEDLFHQVCEEEFNQHTWDELVWIATVLGSRGKLLNGLSLGDHIHVKEIPDFVVGSPYGRDYLKLADYLNKSATNLRTVARETQKSSFEIAGFYNACTILHLVKPADAAEQTELENWNTISSSELERAFAPLGKDLKGPISIVVAGALGDGENNVLSTLSDCLTAEAGADNALAPKQKHDFAMDYGEIFFRRDLRVHLYGVHEHSAYQSRAFLEIMGQAMCEKAWGLLILLDSAEEDPVIKLEYYLKCYGKYLAKLNVAIGVINDGHELSKTSVHVLEYISRQALQFPIVDVNPRNPFDMRGLLKALTCNALDTGVCHDIHSDNPLFGCRC